MGLNKILNQFKELFKDDEGEQEIHSHKQVDSINKLLKKLKTKEHKLKEKLAKEKDKKKLREIQLNLHVLHAQQKKGKKLIKNYKKGTGKS